MDDKLLHDLKNLALRLDSIIDFVKDEGKDKEINQDFNETMKQLTKAWEKI